MTRHNADTLGAVNLERLGQALDEAMLRGLQASDDHTPRTLDDVLWADEQLQTVLAELFGTVVTTPSRTKWSGYLDGIDIAVFQPDVTSGRTLDRIKVARERFGFQLLRAVTNDDLVTLRSVYVRVALSSFRMPMFADVPEGLSSNDLEAMTGERDDRLFRVWHFLSTAEGRAESVH